MVDLAAAVVCYRYVMLLFDVIGCCCLGGLFSVLCIRLGGDCYFVVCAVVCVGVVGMVAAAATFAAMMGIFFLYPDLRPMCVLCSLLCVIRVVCVINWCC